MNRWMGSNPIFRTLHASAVRGGSSGFSGTHNILARQSPAIGGFHHQRHQHHYLNNCQIGGILSAPGGCDHGFRFLSSNSSNRRKTDNYLSLRRVPQRQEQPDPRRGKWRKHAVSLEFGNYEDYDDDISTSPTVVRGTASWQEEEMGLAKQVQEIQAAEDAKRKRWIENARPPVRVPIIDDRGRAYGRGGRKTASARVWIQPGFGHVVVNHRPLEDYFDRQTDRELILAPFAATRTCGKFDVTAIVTGGGLTGQAGAIRHGAARALNHYNPDQYRPALKRLGYLTRDPRKVERKKIGRVKARKSPQWVKR